MGRLGVPAARSRRDILKVVATFYTILLIAAFLAIAGLAALVVTKLFAGQQ
jgi:hypothetical protein